MASDDPNRVWPTGLTIGESEELHKHVIDGARVFFGQSDGGIALVSGQRGDHGLDRSRGGVESHDVVLRLLERQGRREGGAGRGAGVRVHRSGEDSGVGHGDRGSSAIA